MPLKIKVLEVVEGQKIIDAGAASQRVETTHHVWLEEYKPRRFKVNLAKATANEVNTFVQNQGGVLLADIGEMIQQGSFAMYFKSGGEMDVLIKPDTKPEHKPDVKISAVPPSPSAAVVPDSAGSLNRPAQQTR